MEPANGYGDWEVTQLLANAMGARLELHHPSEILDEIARLTPTFAGVSWERLEREGSLQWPVNDKRARRRADHARRRLRARQGQVRGHRLYPDRREDRPALSAAAHHRAHPQPVQCRRADPPHRQRRVASRGRAGDASDRCREPRPQDRRLGALASRAGETTLRVRSPTAWRRAWSTPPSTTRRRRPTSSPPTIRTGRPTAPNTRSPRCRSRRPTARPTGRKNITSRPSVRAASPQSSRAGRMSASTASTKLRRMANQIARELRRDRPRPMRCLATADHIKKFWDPRMKAAIFADDRSRLCRRSRSEAIDELGAGHAPGPASGRHRVQQSQRGRPFRRRLRRRKSGATARAARSARIWVPEAPVALEFNGLAYAVMMATPADLEDFALGFALTEGLAKQPSDLSDIDVAEVEKGWIVRAHAHRPRHRATDRAGPHAGRGKLLRAVRDREPRGRRASRCPAVAAHAALDRSRRSSRALGELARRTSRSASATGAAHAAAFAIRRRARSSTRAKMSAATTRSTSWSARWRRPGRTRRTASCCPPRAVPTRSSRRPSAPERQGWSPISLPTSHGGRARKNRGPEPVVPRARRQRAAGQRLTGETAVLHSRHCRMMQAASSNRALLSTFRGAFVCTRKVTRATLAYRYK